MSRMMTIEEKTTNVRALLNSVRGQIALVTPKHLTPDRILRVAMTSIRRKPKLMDCTAESLLGSLLTCTQLGLEVDGASGQAYLIPYKTTCTLIIGYRGMMALARRSGEIQSLEARVVREKDDFDYSYGASPTLVHKPSMESEPGDVIAAYAVATLRNGAVQFEVMSRAQIDAIRARSRAADDGPWVTDFAEMARKTPMRNLCKYLPSSPELATAVSLDELADKGIPQNIDFVDVSAEPSEPTPDGPPKTLDDLAGKKPEPAPEPPEAVNTPITTADDAPIGIGAGSTLYAKFHNAFKKLNTGGKTAIAKQFSIKYLGDPLEVAGWNEADVRDLIAAIGDAPAEHKAKEAAKTGTEKG